MENWNCNSSFAIFNVILQDFYYESFDALGDILFPFIIELRLDLNSALLNIHNCHVRETLYNLILYLNH